MAFVDPYSPANVEPFGSRASFCGVPTRRVDQVEPGAAVILGAPFDWGTSFRPGQRFGPRAIRDADYLEADGRRPHIIAGIDPLVDLPTVDAGDVPLRRGYVEDSLRAIEHYVLEINRREAFPLILGGDHTITLATASAVARHHGFGELGLLHFDSHADTGVYRDPATLGHGAPMRRLIESGAIPGHCVVQIGLRGYWPPPPILDWMRSHRLRVFFMEDLVVRGLESVLRDAYAVLAGCRCVFMSIDVDVVDPSVAPGTGTPEPGGMSAAELLHAVRRAASELPVVGADIVEVSPAYDAPMNITALLGHRLALETLTGLAIRRANGQL
jgi:agmatinase